jgi:6-phosphofructokinase 1
MEAFPATCNTPAVELQPGQPSREPINIGVVLSGGQAPGGHNVIAGLFDYIKAVSPDSKLIGFRDGPHGIFSNIWDEVDASEIQSFRNTGGFDMLGSGRHKIESEEHFQASMKVCTDLNLHGLVVIGGDDSNSNACLLGEYFKAKGAKTRVVGCPKTIDGDLKNDSIPISFGFDTACRTYAEQVGNVARDALGTQKYYHFVRLMGRSASHIALEVALETRPNICIIGEEVDQKRQSLQGLTQQVADVVEKRAKDGKHFGVVLLPEGLIEFIPEIGELIGEVNELLAEGCDANDEALLAEGKLKPHSAQVFRILPPNIREQMLLDRDPHGNVQVAKIETETLLASTVAAELEARAQAKNTPKIPFVARFHAFGYEGRAALPSRFDAEYCYALGLTAGGLISAGLTSVMASVTNLLRPVEEWHCGGTPIPSMMNFERRKGKWKAVIAKALVLLDGAPFKAFSERREDWKCQDYYRCPGPLQFSTGDMDIPLTLKYELMPAGGTDPDPHVPASAAELQCKPFATQTAFGSHLHRPTPDFCLSALEKERLSYTPNTPACLRGPVKIESMGESQCARPKDSVIIQRNFPKTQGQPLVDLVADSAWSSTSETNWNLSVGVVFCGRQTPGGHNVVTGLHDVLSKNGGKLMGFIGGTRGLLAGSAIEITDAVLANYRNQGGVDLLGRSVDKLDESMADQVVKVCKSLSLGALVLVGGVRTQTDACYLAERLADVPGAPAIIGVPAGIDGAVHGAGVEASIGFDSACHMYAQLVGNTGTDAASARKYYHFLRVMGTSPSHMALEVAMLTRPNAVLLAEEVTHKRQSLRDLVNQLADLVVRRSQEGKDFGIILVPEGIAAAIPELATLIDELTGLQKLGLPAAEQIERLKPWSRAVYQSLPEFIKEGVMLERQSDEKIQLSQIESERLLAELVAAELEVRKGAKTYKGKFNPVCSFLGYQARGSLPSNFDCDLGYTLGMTAAHLAHGKCNGYLAIATGLKDSATSWSVGGLPLVSMLHAEDSTAPPVIPPARVELTGKAHAAMRAASADWVVEELYENPGPLQFGGATADNRSLTLQLEADPGYLQGLSSLHQELEAVRAACRPGCPSQQLQVIAQSLATLTNMIGLFHGEDVSSAANPLKRRRVVPL